jgi:hypothetical protein
MLRLVVAGSAIAAAGVSASGCVDNTETLFVLGVMVAQPPTCIFKPDPTQPILLEGTLDVLLLHSYLAGILVGNQYTPRGAKQNLRAESTRITLRGAEVTLTDSSGTQITCTNDANCGSFTVYGTGFVDTSRSEEPGWGLFSAELIPLSVGKFIQDTMDSKGVKLKTVYAAVKVFGESLGGQDVTSSVLTYPIQICEGCLIDFPLAAVESVGTSGALACVSSASSTPNQAPCIVGQDALVDCRLCAGGNDACKTPFVFSR